MEQRWVIDAAVKGFKRIFDIYFFWKNGHFQDLC